MEEAWIATVPSWLIGNRAKARVNLVRRKFS